MANHQIGQKPLACLGIDLSRPEDRSSPGKWPFIENVIALFDSTVSPRPGLGTSALASGPANKTAWHSIRTLADPSAGATTWTRVHGIGDRLCVELSSAVGTIVDKLGGFSGNPLSLVKGRPTESPQLWMYAADSALMRKVRQDGTLHQIGLPAPVNAPVAVPSAGNYKTIDLFEATTGWAAAGTATAPTLLSAGPGLAVNTTTPAANGSQVIARPSSTGSVFVIAPTSADNIVPGSVLAIQNDAGGTDDVIVEEVFAGSTSVAIERIRYESGTTGNCSITLAAPLKEVRVNSALLITGVASAGSELVVVQEVYVGTDGSTSLRVSTTVQRLATDTVQAKPAFMCYGFTAVNGPLAGGTIKSDGMRTTVPAAVSGSAPATLSKVLTIDLSKTATDRAASLDDWITLLVRTPTPQLLTEMRLFFDCASDSVSAGAFTGTEFTKDYYFKAVTKSDMADMLAYLQTALANRQDQSQRLLLDGAVGGGRYHTAESMDPAIDSVDYVSPQANDLTDSGSGPGSPVVPSRAQLGTGANKFTRVRFRLRDLQRVGSDESRGLKDIVGIRIAFFTSGALVLDLDSYVLVGGSETEVDEIDPGYQYRYRGRCSLTGVVSNASPASIGPVRPQRQPVDIELTQHPSTECDKLDIERWGGPVSGWHWIGTVANGAAASFTDRFSNESARAAAESPISGLDRCQPWPLPIKPLSGTGATVVGNLLIDTNAPFSPSSATLLRFTQVKANGRITYLRRTISSSVIELEDNVGSSATATWEIPRPVLTGQPLPILFGEEWDEQRLIALGDPVSPSAFYVSRKRDFDSTNEFLRFEVPGATLQNGCVYNGTPYIWSTEHLYRIETSGQPDPLTGEPIFRAVIVPGTSGLSHRWACCSGSMMFWLDREGIQASNGSAPSSATDTDLYPIFPHGGLPGIAVRGLLAPNLALTEEANLRLSYGGSRVRFLYRDSGNTRRELEYRIRPGDAPHGWYPHVYTPGIACAYYEEGRGKHAWLMGGADSPTAKLYQLTEAQSDGGTAIAWSAQPQYENVGDPRIVKRWGDFSTEIDRDGATVSVTPKFDKGATALSAISLTTLTGVQIRVHDIKSSTNPDGSGVLGVSMAPLFSGSVTTERPKLYTWEPTWLDRPVTTKLRATDFEPLVANGSAFVRGVWLTFDSLGATRAASVYADGSFAAAVATITGIASSSGPRQEYFEFATPFYASTLLVQPTDANSWMLFDVKWDFDPAPDYAHPAQPWSDLGYAGAKWINGVIIDGDTLGAGVEVDVQVDENVTQTTINAANGNGPVDHDGRAQKQYDFNPPFITHLVRLKPKTDMRLWPTPPTRWIWEPEPELAYHYETQQTTHDIDETWKISRDCMLTVRAPSATPITFSIYNGELGTGSTALFSKTFTPTAGKRYSLPLSLAAIKWRSVIYVLHSASQFAVYRKDTWVRIRGWGRTVSNFGEQSPAGWNTVHPFGSDHRAQGALV